MPLLLIVICLIAGVAIWIVHQQRDDFTLSVNGQSVSKEEYLAGVDAVKYDTKLQIQKEYGTSYGETFWKECYGGKRGYELLTEQAIDWIKRTHAVYDLAKEYGDVEQSGYEAAVARWKQEDESRKEKTNQGAVVYGLKEYSLDLYLKYEISMLKEAYCNDQSREGMNLTEDEIRTHYASREWLFDGSEENADLEMARVAVERELREKKYEAIVSQKAEASQVEGNMEEIFRFTLKNI